MEERRVSRTSRSKDRTNDCGTARPSIIPRHTPKGEEEATCEASSHTLLTSAALLLHISRATLVTAVIVSSLSSSSQYDCDLPSSTTTAASPSRKGQSPRSDTLTTSRTYAGSYVPVTLDCNKRRERERKPSAPSAFRSIFSRLGAQGWARLVSQSERETAVWRSSKMRPEALCLSTCSNTPSSTRMTSSLLCMGKVEQSTVHLSKAITKHITSLPDMGLAARHSVRVRQVSQAGHTTGRGCSASCVTVPTSALHAIMTSPLSVGRGEVRRSRTSIQCCASAFSGAAHSKEKAMDRVERCSSAMLGWSAKEAEREAASERRENLLLLSMLALAALTACSAFFTLAHSWSSHPTR
mmetsp:Transcript_33984/g.87255  ORF Transcript_33984/g.87255 Transcript_33984/m.87255 type:complete len:354 (+) Transcript_33984:3789-4850(+)